MRTHFQEKDDQEKFLKLIKKMIERHDILMKSEFPFYISVIGYFAFHW